ncbi:hypothetical protein QUA81_19015 [Microcoleus sp. F6_B4]
MLVVFSRHSTYQLPITNYPYFGCAVPEPFGNAGGEPKSNGIKSYQLPITTTQKNDRK